MMISLGNKSVAQTNDQSEVNWISFEQLSDSLDSNPKKVLLFFHTDWCAYCKKMQKETFQHSAVIEKINKDYYAVQFDAESTDSITFDNSVLTNQNTIKKRGQYHQIVQVLLGNKNVAFPTMLLLDKDFRITTKKNKYLSIKDLLEIL